MPLNKWAARQILAFGRAYGQGKSLFRGGGDGDDTSHTINLFNRTV